MSAGRGNLKLIQGTVGLLILKTLTRGPQHGYGVSVEIREHSSGALVLDDAALYQALHRLERRGFIASEWGVSENNRRAKFYEITREGRRFLAEETSTWRRYARAVSAVLEKGCGANAMAGLRGFGRRFRFPWRSSRQISRDVDDELAFHLAEKTAALQRASRTSTVFRRSRCTA